MARLREAAGVVEDAMWAAACAAAAEYARNTGAIGGPPKAVGDGAADSAAGAPAAPPVRCAACCRVVMGLRGRTRDSAR